MLALYMQRLVQVLEAQLVQAERTAHQAELAATKARIGAEVEAQRAQLSLSRSPSPSRAAMIHETPVSSCGRGRQ